MLTEERRPLSLLISSAAVICLALASLSVASCNRPAPSDATTAAGTPALRIESTDGLILTADPNPVLSGNPDGKTTVTWNTGSNDVGEVYVVDGENREKLFATGPKGSQEADWIKKGSTEFRLYTQADHKLLARISVTMP